MKIISETTMAEIIEDSFGEIDLDLIAIPWDLKRHLGYVVVNTDHNKVETYYDRTHEWMVPYSRMIGEDDE